MGIRRPGFQLLSLVSPDSSNPYAPTFSDTPCHLPDQMHIYTHVYAICGALSILILAYVNATRGRFQANQPSLELPKISQHPQGVSLLRSSSLNVPSPRVLRSRPVTPIGSPLIPSSPVLLAATVEDDDDAISYLPSPSTAPPTPASYFDLGGEEHSFSLPSPALASDQRPRRPTSWMRTKSRSRPGWVEAKDQPWWSSARNLFDLVGCGSLCSRPQRERGFLGRLVADIVSCAWPPVVVLAIIWGSLFW
jgi:hypothetical protein